MMLCKRLFAASSAAPLLAYADSYQRLETSRHFIDSSYAVNKFRALQFYQTNDSAFKAELKRTKFAVFYERQPLIRSIKVERKDISGSTMNSVFNKVHSLALLSYQDLKVAADIYDFPLNHDDIALLDVVPMQGETNDTNEEWIPIAAFGLKSIHLAESSASLSYETLAKHFEGEFVESRRAYFLLYQSSAANLMSKAKGLLKWNDTYKFCPKCAKALVAKASKASSECPSCKEVYYPTVSPVVITLISDHSNQNVLLVRQPRQLPGVFTAVAGFCETGESLEDTVVRESAEEVGVDISSVRYSNFSRCWPFPQNSLMCAFRATADMNQKLCIDRSELENGRWFSRETVRKAFETTVSTSDLSAIDFGAIKPGEFRFVPPRGTAAHTLIESWLSEEC